MLIDSHMHLHHRNYTKPEEQIIDEAVKEGVTHMINIGTSIEDNKKVLESVDRHPGLFGSAGIYPHDDKDIGLEKLTKTLDTQLSGNKKIIAVGECGFDITEWENGRPVLEQQEIFEMQINLALKHRLPLIVHNRNGDDFTLKTLAKYKNEHIAGVMHCFRQDWEHAKKALDLGFYISFAGNITYPSNKHLLETVEKVPADRFLVETDAPYLPPQGHRGEVNEPKYVKITAEKVAEARKEPFEEVCRDAYNNTCRLFNLNIC